MLTGGGSAAEPAAPPSSADPSTAPSFPAEDVGCARPPPKAAFCFTGQPRTFIHPEAQRSIVRALKSFGELFPGPSKTTRAYLHSEESVVDALEEAGFSLTRTEMTGTNFYFSRLFEAVKA